MVVCLVGSCLPGHWCTSGGAGVSRHGPPLVMPVAVVEAVAFEAPLAVAAASEVASAVVVRSRAGGSLGDDVLGDVLIGGRGDGCDRERTHGARVVPPTDLALLDHEI